MGSLQRYFWPKTVLLFFTHGDVIEAGFGLFSKKEGLRIEERRQIPVDEKKELIEWYRDIARTYPKTFVAGMVDTTNQGALPGCGHKVFQRFDVEYALVNSLCIDGKWSVYLSSVELTWFEQRYKGMIFDFLFSPFVLLHEALGRHGEGEGETVCAVLHRRGQAFVGIFTEGALRFADVLVVSEGHGAIEEESGEEVTDLAFDLDMLEEDEVAPISDVDVLGDFKEGDEELAAAEGDDAVLEMLEYNLEFFDALKASIEKFYRDERYASDFVQKVILFDLEETGDDFVRFVEDELFMEGVVYRADPLATMAALVEKSGEI